MVQTPIIKVFFGVEAYKMFIYYKSFFRRFYIQLVITCNSIKMAKSLRRVDLELVEIYRKKHTEVKGLVDASVIDIMLRKALEVKD